MKTNAASFEVTEQYDILAGYDVLERWRKAGPTEYPAERRHYRVIRDVDADGDPIWDVTVYEANDPAGEVNAGDSLLQLARALTGANDVARPGGGA